MKNIGNKTVTHNHIEYHCEYAENREAKTGKTFWTFDAHKIVVNDDKNSFGMAVCGYSEAECLKSLTHVFLSLSEWGLPADKAAALVRKALGQKKAIPDAPWRKSA